MATEGGQAKASANQQPVSLWAAALNQLKEWDPAWAEHTVKMTTNPWMDGILPFKFIELVSVDLNASRTNLNPDTTRRHIRAALAAGASRQEILFVLKCASVMSIHSFSFKFKAGATVEEIMEVLKLDVVQGVQACNLGVTLLAEELERDAAA
jgi:alkylhydroperoxidase/carboxymuconolactone decarboxylase family protein YurZ